MKRRNGFTLIELLAVIVILAIIALIAVPMILGIVEDAKRDAFLRSVEMVVSTTDLDINTKPYTHTYMYTITDGDISNLNIPIKNTKGMNGSVKYDNKGNTAYAVNNGKYCVVKEYSGQVIIKDYDEICEYADYPADSCFMLEYEDGVIADLEITDKAVCENTLTSMGFSSATALCNGEASSELNGMTLKQILMESNMTAEEMRIFGVTPIYSSISGGSGSILNYLCTNKKIIIPEEINGVKIVSITDGAFWGKGLMSVEIPNSVTSIGSSAFNNNKLPDSQAFIYARNSDGSIDNTKIVSYGGIKRENVVIPNNVATIGASALSNNQLVSVEIPSSVTSIGEFAFANNQLTSVEIHFGVTKIEHYAFAHNQLTSVEIPSSVTSIGQNAFVDNQLTSVEIPNSVTSIEYSAFANNQLVSVEIPSSVTSIESKAFENNQLTSIEIPSSVTRIGEFAFANNQLTSIDIPNSVTSIGYHAFENNQLISVEIPSSVTWMGLAAFNNNQLPDNQAFIYDRKSDGSINNTTLVSYGGAKRDNVVIPDNVVTIDSDAFANIQLTSITIPSSVTSIGYSAFINNQLTNVVIPSSVKNIKAGAFENNHLISVELSNSLTRIESYVFRNNRLTSVTIPDSVTYIEFDAFRHNQLTSITIPSNVKSIEHGVFNDNQLTSVIIKGKNSTSDFTKYGKNAFGWASGYSDANITFVTE